jgi:hypothetical protein
MVDDSSEAKEVVLSLDVSTTRDATASVSIASLYRQLIFVRHREPSDIAIYVWLSPVIVCRMQITSRRHYHRRQSGTCIVLRMRLDVRELDLMCERFVAVHETINCNKTAHDGRLLSRRDQVVAAVINSVSCRRRSKTFRSPITASMQSTVHSPCSVWCSLRDGMP